MYTFVLLCMMVSGASTGRVVAILTPDEPACVTAKAKLDASGDDSLVWFCVPIMGAIKSDDAN